MYSDKSYQSQLASLIPSASSSPIDLDTIYSEFFFSLANQKVVVYEIKTVNPETPIIVTVAQNQVSMPSLQSSHPLLLTPPSESCGQHWRYNLGDLLPAPSVPAPVYFEARRRRQVAGL
jgi:hypothetical protein